MKMVTNHIYASLLVFAFAFGCASPDDPSESPEEMGEIDPVTGEVDSGERATAWDEISYKFSANGNLSGCNVASVKIDASFRYTFEDCRGRKNGWVNQKKISHLKKATSSALRATGQKIQCTLLGLKPVMLLEIRSKQSGNAIALRKFEDKKDCIRGETDFTEALNSFMAELLSQLQSRK